MISLKIGSLSDLEAAFVSAVRQHADALLVTSNSIFTDRRVELSDSQQVMGCPRVTLGANSSKLVG